MVKIDKDGYVRQVKHSTLIHRQIAYHEIYLKNRDKYPLRFSEYVVHHKDRNKLNNHVSNLEILKSENHAQKHPEHQIKRQKGINWKYVLVPIIMIILAGVIFSVIYSLTGNTNSSLIDCSSNKYDCSDFNTSAEAQKVFEACGGPKKDVHYLDSDKDGIVCESLK